MRIYLKDNESTIYIQLVNNFLNQDSLIAIQNYKFLKNKYPNNSYENVLNSIGYELLRLKQYDIAIKVFKLNIDENLNSWNSYDSLGEAYELIGNTTGALKNYKKSFKLNPDNENAESKIKLLDKLSSKE